jgi:hypothetical protein
VRHRLSDGLALIERNTLRAGGGDVSEEREADGGAA